MMENQELFDSFIEEASEVLADLENDFLQIEAAGENVDAELVNRVFRGIHSMKGSAGFLGLKSIGTLAHEMENVLNQIRNNELVPTRQVVEALLRGGDALQSMTDDLEQSNSFDVSDHIKQLQNAVEQTKGGDAEPEEDREIDIPHPNGGLAFIMIPEGDLTSRQKQGMSIYLLCVDMIADVHAYGLNPIEFLKKSYNHGELINSYASTAGVQDLKQDLPESLDFIMLFASALEPEALAKALNLSPDKIHLLATSDQRGLEKAANQEAAPQTSAVVQPQAEKTPKASTSTPSDTPAASMASSKQSAQAKAASAAPSHAQTSLRVNVRVLDTLMNLAGELVLGRNQLLQINTTRDFQSMDAAVSRLDQITSEIQEAVMQTRMQPVGTVFNKFPRIVRDLSSKLNKKCELEIEGGDVELDKSIIEGIGDPLTHLIRNSVDHGIELPEERQASGKNVQGQVVLKAFHQAGKVHITISDDGAGINAEKLKTKAVEKGVLSAEEAQQLSERDAVRLIFHPGFSMAKQITDVSGRGVGMDVVRTNIEALGGIVDIETTIGQGTTISIKLPLTLAIIPSLIIRSGANRYALPQVNISELVRVKAQEVSSRIERLKDAEVLRLRDTLLPLVRLSQVLDLPSTFIDSVEEAEQVNQRVNLADRRSDDDPPVAVQDQRDGGDRRENTCAGALNIIVLETGQQIYGLVVDELYDSEEIVVKPLGRHLTDCPCLAGATVLGDGKVSLILDASGIASQAKLKVDQDEIAHSDHLHGPADTGEETQSVLVFTNHPDDYFALPTSFITRIERIRSDQVDTVGGKEVLQYRGASLPLISLEKHVQAHQRTETTHLFVIVFNVSGLDAGLIATDLKDIHNMTTDLDTATFREQGIVGSAIVNEQTMRVVDVFELIKTGHPDWITQQAETPASLKTTKPRILLAEDSSFFRQQMVGFLESSDLEVVGCEDGSVAWRVLQDPEEKFDLVITDIEMPNMDGLELARHIRNEISTAHLPIIAVTSLAGDDDVKRGKDAGVTEYQVKLDRDALLAAIQRLLKEAREKAGQDLPQQQEVRA